MLIEKTDSELQHDVMEELRDDPRLDHAHIGVAAENGVVTLSGFVPTYAQKMAAEKAACRVYGVAGVAEEIKVRFADDPKTADSEIAQRILAIFDWDVEIPQAKLRVKVERGFVTLTGTVAWPYQRRAAQKAAGKISGVKAIINLIEVETDASVDDVRERIVAALKRSSADDDVRINVVLDGGTVRLGGIVHGWNERRVAERAAWSAAGVTDVIDNIVLT